MDSKMFTPRLLLILSLLNVAIWACDENNGAVEYEKLMERQDYPEMDSLNYPYNDYSWFKPNYQTASQIPDDEIIEGRSPLSRLRPQSNNYFSKGNNNNRQNNAESRFGLGPFKLGLASMFLNTPFGNTNTGNTPSNPFASFIPKNPPYIANPNYGGGLAMFDSCTTPNAESGICTSSSVCSLFGGRPSGACVFGTVCCVNSVNKCNAVVTLNNTIWTSPVNPVNSNSGCGLTLKVDSNLIEQKKRPVCQIRLDFASFNIAQPNLETVCSTDTFSISGATNKVPIICGDNSGQHMYLNVPGTSSSDLQLQFNFGQSTTSRFWNIKIAMIPCGANYAAPTNCLQYFTGTTGSVSSFNWADVPGTAPANVGDPIPRTTRQLANQDYKVCFRTELVSQKSANSLCLTPCTVTNGGTSFSVSTPNTAATGLIADVEAAEGSQTLAANCNNDFLIFPGGFDPNPVNPLVVTDPTNANDRYCGERFNPQLVATVSSTVCSTSQNFVFYYKTNGDETATATQDGVALATTNRGNIGFCFTFAQSV